MPKNTIYQSPDRDNKLIVSGISIADNNVNGNLDKKLREDKRFIELFQLFYSPGWLGGYFSNHLVCKKNIINRAQSHEKRNSATAKAYRKIMRIIEISQQETSGIATQQPVRDSVLGNYKKALHAYQEQSMRGYSYSFLSRFRHSACEYDALQELRFFIKKSNDDTVIRVLHHHFLFSNTQFNNHSFNSYFIDELQLNSNVRHEPWSNYMRRPVKLHSGIVYRGTSVPMATVFSEGLEAKHTSDLTEKFVQYPSLSIGLSTTTIFGVALYYALSNQRRNHKRVIYVLRSSLYKAYDITKTAQSRGQGSSRQFIASFARGKAEVNIKGPVRTQDIIGAYDVTINGVSGRECRFIENPNYNGPDFNSSLLVEDAVKVNPFRNG